MSKEKKKNSRTYIGGQAVLEGVMMRGKKAYATAVRDPEGNIQVESRRLHPSKGMRIAAKIRSCAASSASFPPSSRGARS